MAARKKKKKALQSAVADSNSSLQPSAPAPALEPDVSNTADNNNAAAIAAEPEKKTGLMDLPVELRTIIYEYVLQEEAPIKLNIRHVRRRKGRFICRAGGSPQSQTNFLKNGSRPKNFVPAALKHSSVLYINKQIRAEAEPILYGCNTMSFQRVTVLKDFLEVIGNRAQHLRYIRIEDDGYVVSTIRPAMELLRQARGLRKLELGHIDACSGRGYQHIAKVSIEDIASALVPLAISLQESREQHGVKGNVLDVFGFHVNPHCWLCEHPTGVLRHRHLRGFSPWRGCRCWCEKVREGNDDLEKMLRKELAALAGL